MTRIVLDFNVKTGIDALDNLLRAANDLTPVNKDMGEYLVPATQRRFDSGTAPDGSKWAPNTPLTLSRKRSTKPGIGETRSLSTQIHYQASADSLIIGSLMEYAGTFHFGALMGAFGRYYQLSRRTRYAENDYRRAAGSKKGHPIPWANIPARPFLGLSGEDKAELSAILIDYFSSGLSE